MLYCQKRLHYYTTVLFRNHLKKGTKGAIRIVKKKIKIKIKERGERRGEYSTKQCITSLFFLFFKVLLAKKKYTTKTILNNSKGE